MKQIIRKLTGILLLLFFIAGAAYTVYAVPQISNVSQNSDGKLTWTAVAGTEYYVLDIDHPDVPASLNLGKVTETDLNEVFDSFQEGYPTVVTGGNYGYYLYAINSGGERIAGWHGYFAYHYTPPAPIEASVSADNILTWKAYPGAVSYFYNVDDKGQYAEDGQLQADLKSFITSAVVSEGLSNSGTHTVTLYAYDSGGSQLQHWEGTCNFTASLNLKGAQIAGVAKEYYYTGDPIIPEVIVIFGGDHLKEGEDYKLEYANNTDLGTATITATGKGRYSGKTVWKFSIVEVPAKDPSSVAAVLGIDEKILKEIPHLTITVPDQTYTGKALKPSPEFSYAAVKLNLKKGTDYKVSYTANKKIGTASMTVTGKGSYSGKQTVSFDIVPKGTTLKKVRPGSRRMKVSWKKQTKQVTGYRIQYSLQKTFAKAKTVTVSGAGTTGRVIKKLKKGKRYYVRICTYKKVKSKKYCSAWSKVKKVIVR